MSSGSPNKRATVRVAVAPAPTPHWVSDAVVEGGGILSDIATAEALIWSAARQPGGLAELLASKPEHLRWIQLPFAGIENFWDAGVFAATDVDGRPYRWTCGKGVYAEPVAELALAMLLAGFRGLGDYVRATSWQRQFGRNLHGTHIVVLGGGGITESLLRMLGPFGCRTTVLRKTAQPMPGAGRVLGIENLHDELPHADAVVLALALTPETYRIIGTRELALMHPDSWIINVARGGHIDTGALVDALAGGVIAGAGLDVTDPEPLPDGHALWSMSNVIITPHTGNTPEMARPLLAERISLNVRRYIAGEALIGPVDLQLGY